jgi:hypothetical protein
MNFLPVAGRPQEMADTDVAREDRHLRRSLGMWQLTAIGFSGVIGSGWLLGAYDRGTGGDRRLAPLSRGVTTRR